jgi:hypothetical protein
MRIGDVKYGFSGWGKAAAYRAVWDSGLEGGGLLCGAPAGGDTMLPVCKRE